MTDEPIFDVSLTTIGDQFSVAVPRAYPSGSLGARPFDLPFALSNLPVERRNLEAWIKEARQVMRGESQAHLLAREFGTRLFNSLAPIHSQFHRSYGAIEGLLNDQTVDRYLRLRLRFSDQLMFVPWELLYDEQASSQDPEDRFLALNDKLSLVRYLETQARVNVEPSRVDGALRILVVLASPDTHPPLRLELEKHRITDALASQIEHGKLQIEFIDTVDTAGALEKRMARRSEPVHILHVLCHGEMIGQRDADKGELVFVDPEGKGERVNGRQLWDWCKPQRQNLRLVFLNACHSGMARDPFSSVGAALVRQSIPAVIAMQFAIPDDTAAEIARVFYRKLALGMQVDKALTETRRHLFNSPSNTTLDWAVPVLFMSSEEAVLFDMAQVEQIAILGNKYVNLRAPLPDNSDSETDELLKEVEWKILDKKYIQAYEMLLEIVQISPTNKGAKELLPRVNMICKCQEIYGQALDIKKSQQSRAQKVRLIRKKLDEINKLDDGYFIRLAGSDLNLWLLRQTDLYNSFNKSLDLAQRQYWYDAMGILQKESLLIVLEDEEVKDVSERYLSINIKYISERVQIQRGLGNNDSRIGVCTHQPDWCQSIHPLRDTEYALLNPFRLSRYPVTVWQFKRFWENGYSNDIWWDAAGLNWRSSALQIERRSGWTNYNWSIANQPVVDISCYEATAFCRWISAEGWADGWLSAGREIRLPTEGEWELAVVDRAVVDIPEENELKFQVSPLRKIRYNVIEAKINSPWPVGLFTENASSCGALDMLGNVWEWCLSDAADRVSLGGGVLRGGSYDSSETTNLAAVKEPAQLQDYSVDYGFRLCEAMILT